VAPLEPWEKVLVSSESYMGSIHGTIACTTCHLGENAAEKEAAHTGLISRPSEDPGKVCGTCHADIAEVYPDSLHASQAGYWTTIDARNAPEDHPALEEMFGNHCASCHTSCGDCHVSQPQSVGGGLIDGHNFNATPSLTRNCTACHGSRVGNEYMGKHEDIKADVHFRQGRMKCTDCHTAAEMHGDYANIEGFTTDSPMNRYEGGQLPECTQCHTSVGSADEGIQMHQTHGDKLSCQVCHSVSYSSCDGCHVQTSDDTGNPYFATEGTYLTFFIGKNPIKSDERPYEYVTLRHIPVSPTSYSFYTGAEMANYDALPTWSYATPHNIQRETPQNASCEACHGNQQIFLTADKVAEGELTANQSVIVEKVPAPVGEMTSEIEPMPENHAVLAAGICLNCHAEGGEDIPKIPEGHAEYDPEGCLTCHTTP
jgi:thiosulfate/3-mercaptopyruvate sulfurtransferase